jgi:restriction system protein
MTIPDFQTMMLPILKLSGDGKEHSRKECADYISDLFSLSGAEKGSVSKLLFVCF